MTVPYDVTVYGETCLHVLTSARPSPHVGLGQVELVAGGPAAVVATQLALLGDSPRLISQVGTDLEGAYVLDSLRRVGVDCSDVRRHGRTGRIVASVEHGEVELAADGTAAAGVIGPDNLPLPDTGFVYATGFPSLVPVIRSLAEDGHHMVVDLGFIPLVSEPDALADHIHELAGAIDVAVLSGAQLTPGDRARLRQLCFDDGASAVLTTLAADGVHVATRKAERHLRPVPVEQVDPLCAGDAFVAGFLHRRIAGDDVFDAAHFAQHVAATKVSMFGRLPSSDDVRTLLS